MAKKNFFIGALVGSVIGGITVALTTPKKGGELRADIKKQSEELYSESKEKVEKVKESTAEVISETKEKVSEFTNETKEKVSILTEDVKAKFEEGISDTKSKFDKNSKNEIPQMGESAEEIREALRKIEFSESEKINEIDDVFEELVD